LELVGQAIRLFTVISAPQLHLVERQLEMKRLVYISLLEVQLVLELEAKALTNSRFFIEHQYLLEQRHKQQSGSTLHREGQLHQAELRQEILLSDCTQHQEPQLEQELAALAT
jgi:hypothetical protein